ncbi:MAG: winged helix-turn-helix transcriptional regulator [bacterium]|nr:winged helix-turn-helix transcriptional regulator [bacterium]
MIEKIKKVSNPLSIIAIFAALAEVVGTTSFVLVDKEIQSIFIWFVMGFPTLLVLLFFITLIFKTHVLYAPSDFENDDNFLKLLNRKLQQSVEVAEDEVRRIPERISNTIPNLEKREELRDLISKEMNVLQSQIKTTKDLALNITANALPKSEQQAKILSYLCSENRPMSITELASLIGMGENATKKSIEKLEKRGVVKKEASDGNDVYNVK